MNTIIRANGVIANPQPGGLLLPRLGVSGVVARWHASGQGGPGAITTIKDVMGRGNDLPVTSGAVSVALVGGRPALDFGAAGAGNAALIASIQGTNKKRSIAVLFQLAAFPAAASYMVATTNPAGNSCGIGVVYGNNRICTYRNAGATLSSGAPTALNTWIAAVGTFDDDALQAGGILPRSPTAATSLRARSRTRSRAPWQRSHCAEMQRCHRSSWMRPSLTGY